VTLKDNSLKIAHLMYLLRTSINTIFVTTDRLYLLNKTPDPQEYKTHQKSYKN
jgi:hypothetical protein